MGIGRDKQQAFFFLFFFNVVVFMNEETMMWQYIFTVYTSCVSLNRYLISCYRSKCINRSIDSIKN